MALTPITTELLDIEKIRKLIEPENQRLLARLDIFDSINSTSTYLLECAKSCAEAGWLCFAEQQTRGRGRLGRSWYSPRGANIYCSLLWRFPPEQQNISTLSLAVAVIVANVLHKYGVKAHIGLKWPNDVLCVERKLAGILLEGFQEKNGENTVVIGLGINVQLPESADAAWIDLAEITGNMVERNYLAGLLVNELLGGLRCYQQQGWDAFKNAWDQYDVLRGKEIIVQRNEESICGVMRGVNEKGELLLQTASDEILHFQCGEVSVRGNSKKLFG